MLVLVSILVVLVRDDLAIDDIGVALQFALSRQLEFYLDTPREDGEKEANAEGLATIVVVAGADEYAYCCRRYVPRCEMITVEMSRAVRVSARRHGAPQIAICLRLRTVLVSDIIDRLPAETHLVTLRAPRAKTRTSLH
ncbi:hypothetical protein C8Q80DRAFT_1124082 [Daedaleopsis nitida]|nr:hypothetical protein C8Q80DRAFT_1124082 [Daedaleopsis nitida]